MPEKRLLDNGDGLFNTHVYLEDVQNVIEQQLKTNSKIGPNVKYTVVGDGNGFMSRVILVDPDWTEKDENLPSKFILKITSCLHVHGICEKMKQDGTTHFTPEQEEQMLSHFEKEAQCLHNREVNLYKIIKDLDIHQKILAPKVYFAQKFDLENTTKGFIGMEFVEDVTVRHLYENIDVSEIDPILRSLAVLQAKSLHLNSTQIDSISGFDFRELMGKMMDAQSIHGMLEAAKKIDEAKLGEIIDKVQTYGTGLYMPDLIHNLNEHVGIKHNTLVHGDLWSANILWNCQKGENKAEKIIDYQLIHMGNPAEDLVRVFLSTLSGKDCHEQWEPLVERFYTFFLEELEGEEAPYSLEQLKQSYKYYYVTGAMIMLVMFGPIAQMKIEYSGAENKEELRHILAEKAQYMLYDIDKYYLYTKEHFAHLF